MGSGNDILNTYIYETNTLLEQLESIVLDAEKFNSFSQESVNEIFRIMHTIKGASAMMEYTALATISHRIEDLFFLIRDQSMDVVPESERPALFDVLFQAIDYFRGEVGKIEAGQPLDTDIDQLLACINTLIGKIKGEDASPAAAVPAPAAPAQPQSIQAQAASAENASFAYTVSIFFDDGCGMESLRAFMLVSAVQDFCAQDEFSYYPADVQTNAESSKTIAESGFLMMFRSAQSRDKAVSIIKSTGSVRAYEAHDPPQTSAPATTESMPAAAGDSQPPAQTPAVQAAQHGQQSAKESLISVNLSKLDALMAVVGEIVIARSMLTSSPDLKGLQLDNFTKSARQLHKLTDELQDVSMSLRMVSVSGTFQKMNRIVRDMSKKLGKQVKLTLIGEDTEVDKTIVDNIGDPIMHMIRNSMDHGIESDAQQRIDAGKDAVGEIILSAADSGSEVIIQVIDDGQGADLESILKKAIKNGIASPDIEYSDRDVLNFLMLPGFSTNAKVTEFSGRGVGMDVVKRGIEELGGTVSLASTAGQGMTTTMRIPLTMAIMNGMEVSVGSSTFTIPINNIRQSFRVSEQHITRDSAKGEIIKCMDQYYPIVRARDFYRLDEGVTNVEDGILMWLEAGDDSFCLLVDELLGEQQVVVKQLPAYVNTYNIKEHGINGCTLLGDGSISIILDVANLYHAAFGK